jgi:hypothetical protein
LRQICFFCLVLKWNIAVVPLLGKFTMSGTSSNRLRHHPSTSKLKFILPPCEIRYKVACQWRRDVDGS